MRPLAAGAACGLAILVASGATGAAGRTERVSVSSAGRQGNLSSAPGNASDDGRFVVFDSDADNLVARDTNGAIDVFLLDRRTRQVLRVSVASSGRQADGSSFPTAISDDGRLVVFSSFADNLVAGDTNGVRDVFVRDVVLGATRRVSVATGGVQGNGDSFGGALSDDGGLVAFSSEAPNLVPLDQNDTPDVFVRDLARRTTERVSVASDGSEANPGSFSFGESMSAGGRFYDITAVALPPELDGRTIRLTGRPNDEMSFCMHSNQARRDYLELYRWYSSP